MNDKVIISNLEILATNGVNPEEKINKQRFIFSIEVGLDFLSNASVDNIDNTISYSAVRKLITPFVENSSFNLLEKLAYEVGKLILINFNKANYCKILIKKPDAPMKGKFDFVGVETTLIWHKTYIALGSSLGNKDEILNFAINEFKADSSFKNCIESKRYKSMPFGGIAKEEFLNSVIEIDTLYEPNKLLEVLHNIENKAGRERLVHWGDRTLDLDILFYDNLILSNKDLCIPHYDLHNRDFVLKPLLDINPNLYHPILNKRISALYEELKNKNNFII